MRRQVISISQRAADKIKELMTQREGEAMGIRVSVKSGGCSGLSYMIEYADDKLVFEEIIEDKGVRVLLDPKAIMYVIGSEMDYVENDFKEGFIFTNPNERIKCGCGKSFNV